MGQGRVDGFQVPGEAGPQLGLERISAPIDQVIADVPAYGIARPPLAAPAAGLS